MKRVELFLCCVLLALALVLELCGCTNNRVLYSSESLHVERYNHCLIIEDLNTSSEYLLHVHRTNREAAEQQVKTVVDTEFVMVETSGRLVVITDRVSQKRIYIKL